MKYAVEMQDGSVRIIYPTPRAVVLDGEEVRVALIKKSTLVLADGRVIDTGIAVSALEADSVPGMTVLFPAVEDVTGKWTDAADIKTTLTNVDQVPATAFKGARRIVDGKVVVDLNAAKEIASRWSKSDEVRKALLASAVADPRISKAVTLNDLDRVFAK